ncbi:MAG: PAS domain S-box protein [Candidatus Bathyarchaeia archaeon]
MTESTAEPIAEALVELNEKEPIRVLHVDDDSGFVKVTKQCLEMEAPVQVDTAVSVDEALTKLRTERYDVVVSDYQMPEKDGLEFLKELREKGNTIPFIMFTGKGREEIAIRALNLGADQYLNKSGDPETVYKELAHAVRQAVERKTALEKIRESEQKYRSLVELAPDGIIAVDLNGTITSVNDSFLKIVGYDSDKVVGRHFTKIESVRPQDIPRFMELFRSVMERKSVSPIEFSYVRRDGESRWAEVHPGSLMKDGKVVGLQVIMRDITERKRVEKALTESEEQSRAIVINAPIGIATSDADKHFVSANDTFCKILGYTEELRKLTFMDITHPEDIKESIAKMEFGAGRKSFFVQEKRYIKKDGNVIVGRVKVSAIRDQHGKPRMFVAELEDITERKETEEALAQSEAKYRSLVEQSLQGIAIAQGVPPRLVFVNPAMVAISGYSQEELASISIICLIHPDDRDIFFTRLKERFEGKPSVSTNEYRAIRKDGTILWIALTSNRIQYNGQPAVQATFIDITQRKKAEEELLKGAEKYRELFENATDLIVTLDLQGNVTSVNNAILRFGYEKKEIIGKNISRFILKPYWPTIINDLSQVAQGKSVQNETGIKTPQADLTAEYRANPIVKDGNIIGVQVILRDVTERKRAEEAISKSEERFRSLVEKTSVPIATSDLKGRFTYLNKALAELLGYSTEELLHRPFKDFLHPKDRGKITRLFLGAILLRKEPYSFEFRVLHKDGHILHLMSKPTRLAINGKTVGFQAIIVDITDRKKAEKLILESQQKFAGLFRNNPEATAYLGPDCRVLDINPRFEKLFGYSLEEIKGKRINDVVVPESRTKEGDALDKEAMKEYVYRDTIRRRKDGSLVPVAASAAPIKSSGKIAGIIVTYHDISDLKNTEKMLETVNEKLHVIGGLTRHDARNKLTAIKGNLYLAKKHLSGSPEALKYLDEAESACQQVAKIFDFATAYERLGIENLGPMEPRKAFDEAVSQFSDMRGIRITNNCQDLTVLADSLLSQLFYNLIHNSLKYGQKTTAITVRYEKTGEDTLRLIYEDDGVGIPAANKPHLFQEGYGTGGSTGLGLYLIKKMMEVYGWTIQETGEPGKGAQFTITIPRQNQNGKENYQVP